MKTAEWELRRECLGMPPQLWEAAPTTQDHRVALAICAICPVARQCAAKALSDSKTQDITEATYSGVYIHKRQPQRRKALARLEAKAKGEAA